MENIPNCLIEQKKNFNEINGLNLLMKMYPFLIQSFHLKNDSRKLEADLYIFLSKFTSFPKEEILNLKDRNILILFLFLVLNEKNLQINQFTNDIITILKNHNNKF